jgi:type II secretory pathway pseudopilin PulG
MWRMNTMFLSLSKEKGVTLLEVLLVLVIASSILVMIISYSNQRMNQLRMDRTVMQIQQILNAGLAYYVNKGQWPELTDLQSSDTKSSYLSAYALKNPWGKYDVSNTPETGVFTVTFTASKLPNNQATEAILMTLAGQLPNASTSSSTRTVTSSVNIPGQNLNNARSVNFAAIYSSGACVPAPKCPTNMVPQIMVVPVAVRGINDTPTPAGSTPTVYPLTSFTAFARGKLSNNSMPAGVGDAPGDCSVMRAPQVYACQQVTGDPPNTEYWRVCLSLTTEKGIAYPPNYDPPSPSDKDAHGVALGSVLAITRCAPANETPTGTPFGVFTPNQMWDK